MMRKILLVAMMALVVFSGCGKEETKETTQRSESADNVKKLEKEAGQQEESVLQEENKVLFSYEVSTDMPSDTTEGENSIGYVGANEGEKIVPDAFYVAGDQVFIDNPVFHNIMVYQSEDFVKQIPLSWEMDVKLMYYDEKSDTLKMVYRNLDEADATHLYLTSVGVDKEEKVSAGKELSNKKKVLLECCFDENGELRTEYLKDSDKENALTFTDEIGSGIVLNSTADLYTLSDGKTSGKSTGEVCVLLKNSDKKIHYAVPEKDDDVLERGNLQVTDDGTVYQMIVDTSGVRIFELGEKTVDTVEELLQKVNGESKEKLTLEIVKELAKKGEELTWTDFEAYEGSDVGSGAYVYCYELDNDLKLMITGASLEEKPMNICLVKGEDTENGIDIRTEDIDVFLGSE